MSQVSVYLVADYNPKYLDGSIRSAVSRLVRNVQEDDDILNSFTIQLEQEVRGLSRNSAKALLKAEVETERKPVKMVEKLNGELRLEISDQSIYSVTVSSSSSAKKYSDQY